MRDRPEVSPAVCLRWLLFASPAGTLAPKPQQGRG